MLRSWQNVSPAQWQSFELLHGHQPVFELPPNPDPCLRYQFAAAVLYGVLFIILRAGAFDRLFPYYRSVSGHMKIDLISRLSSTINAAISVIGGYYFFFIDDHNGYTDVYEAAFGICPLRNIYLSLTCGYLMYDLVLCLCYKSALANNMILVHHTLIITAFSLGVYNRIGTYVMATFLLNEVSTLFLNANAFMACLPYLHRSCAYKLNAILFLITFFICRIALNTFSLGHLVFFTWRHAAPLFWLRASFHLRLLVCFLTTLAFGHCFVNLLWFRSIITATQRKVFRPPVVSASPPNTSLLAMLTQNTHPMIHGHLTALRKRYRAG